MHYVVSSATTASIAWIPGFDGGLLQTFYIEYKQDKDKAWSLISVKENKTLSRIRSFTVTDLTPDTRYEVRMFSGDVVGNSSKTDSIYFETEGKWVL